MEDIQRTHLRLKDECTKNKVGHVVKRHEHKEYFQTNLNLYIHYVDLPSVGWRIYASRYFGVCLYAQAAISTQQRQQQHQSSLTYDATIRGASRRRQEIIRSNYYRERGACAGKSGHLCP